jgi:hypothetical protein
MRIVTEGGDLMQRTEDDQAHVGYTVAGQSRGQMMLCAICTVQKEMGSAGDLSVG